jgi:putative DNA methylase
MGRALRAIQAASHPGAPTTIYYAFKQSESDAEGDASTGWEAFLAAVLDAGWTITATWPMRTERGARSVSIGTNALASSIVLALRARPADATTISRRDFLRELRDELPLALDLMIGGAEGRAPIAPVDLAQAAIGPGMAIFSRHAQVLEADGSPMSVRQALIHINKAIDDYFTAAEGEMDADTRFCVDWFQQYGFATGKFGEADVLARAKGTSVEGLVKAGVLHAQKGDVRLVSVKEYPARWDPREDDRVPVWEACHHLCRALDDSEAVAGQLVALMPDKQEAARQLAYRLYTLCERKGWAQDAGRYNALVTSWPAIVERSREAGLVGQQLELGG